MSSPARKMSRVMLGDSNTISMVIEDWSPEQVEQYSPMYRIGGYPWRLRLYNGENGGRLELHCEKSTEAELWECTATIITSFNNYVKTFHSWNERSKRDHFPIHKFIPGTLLKVQILTNEDGDKWRSRPIHDPFELHDGILVIGDEKKKLHVNKQSLASQSSFFEKLFFGDFKEKNMEEIPIADIEYEEFSNMIRLLFSFDGAYLTAGNVHRVLELADRFDLKIVEDKVVNYLLSTSYSVSIHQRLLISEQYNIPYLKKKIIARYTLSRLKALSQSTVWDQLSKETTRAIVNECCDSEDEQD